MKLHNKGIVAVVVASSLALVSPIEGRALFHCSGWLPMDCRGIYGCKNCYDGQRIDCFPETNSTFVYGEHLYALTNYHKG